MIISTDMYKNEKLKHRIKRVVLYRACNVVLSEWRVVRRRVELVRDELPERRASGCFGRVVADGERFENGFGLSRIGYGLVGVSRSVGGHRGRFVVGDHR